MVGLIPLFATSVFDGEMMDKLPVFRERVGSFVGENSDLMPQIGNTFYEGLPGRRLLSPLIPQKLTRVIERMHE